jgi:hypothetical protein
MITALVASLLLHGEKLSDVHLRQGFESRGEAVVSPDGQKLFTYSGSRWDLATGRSLVGETLFVGLLKGNPPVVVSRTTSQGIRHLPNDQALSQNQGPSHLGDAMGPDRLLFVTEPATPLQPRMKYIVLTEARLEARGEHPNIDWVLALPNELHSRAVGLKYLNGNTVELWVLNERPGRHELVRYLGSRAHPGALRQDARVPLTHYPKALLNSGFVFNSFDPAKKTYIYQAQNGFNLARTDGKVIRTTSLANLDSKRWPDLEAIWRLTVPDSAVVGGKKAWEPMARSTNNRFWLLKNSKTGEIKLLSL